jgi:predicted transcriptional regulator
MNGLPDLAPAELEVMDALWKKGEASAKVVHRMLNEKRKLAYNTVSTVLTRLRDKGYVVAREQNFAYVYTPLVTREQVQERKLDDLVKVVLRGSLSPIAAYIARNKKLTQEQIHTLEEMLEESQANDSEG